MFNTGDLGYVNARFRKFALLKEFIRRRWHPNGTLEHLGRIDNQVKVKVNDRTSPKSLIILTSHKGFRVELDGVASSMEVRHGCY